MSTDARFVDVSYRGLKVAVRARLLGSGPDGFVEVEAPMPVGTRLTLTGDVIAEVQVVGVVEQESGAKSPPGMRIAWAAAAAVPKPEPEPEPEAAVEPEPAAEPEAAAEPEVEAAPLASASSPTVPNPSPSPTVSDEPSEDVTSASDGRRTRRNRKKTQIGRP
jgi:hypothetical protein